MNAWFQMAAVTMTVVIRSELFTVDVGRGFSWHQMVANASVRFYKSPMQILEMITYKAKITVNLSRKYKL